MKNIASFIILGVALIILVFGVTLGLATKNSKEEVTPKEEVNSRKCFRNYFKREKKNCPPLKSSSRASFFAFFFSCLHFGTLQFCQQSSQVNAWPYFCLALAKPWSDNRILFSGFSFFPPGTILQGQPACPAYEHVENPLLCTNDFQMGHCCWKSS